MASGDRESDCPDEGGEAVLDLDRRAFLADRLAAQVQEQKPRARAVRQRLQNPLAVRRLQFAGFDDKVHAAMAALVFTDFHRLAGVRQAADRQDTVDMPQVLLGNTIRFDTFACP